MIIFSRLSHFLHHEFNLFWLKPSDFFFFFTLKGLVPFQSVIYFCCCFNTPCFTVLLLLMRRSLEVRAPQIENHSLASLTATEAGKCSCQSARRDAPPFRSRERTAASHLDFTRRSLGSVHAYKSARLPPQAEPAQHTRPWGSFTTETSPSSSSSFFFLHLLQFSQGSPRLAPPPLHPPFPMASPRRASRSAAQ